MKLEHQVVPLKMAKRLKELGVAQESLLKWIYPADPQMISTTYGVYHHEQAKDIVDDNEGDESDSEASAAFTVAELGVMLPDGSEVKSSKGGVAQFNTFRSIHESAGWVCYADYSSPSGITDEGFEAFQVWKQRFCKTESEARSAMLIHLLETGLITVEEVNRRLQDA